MQTVEDIERHHCERAFARTSTAAMLAVSGPPMRGVIPFYVGEGLSILAGRQKLGKTWLALDWAIAVAGGGLAMGAIACEQGDVLYFDHENGRRLMRARIDTLFPDAEARPDLSRLEWLTDELPPRKGLVEVLDDWRIAVRSPRLVVLDASHRVTVKAGPGADLVANHQVGLIGLRQWAAGHGIAVLYLLRTRKTRARDPIEEAANRIFACADTVLLLDRDAGGATLQVRGRDVEDKETALRFAAGRWSWLGDASPLRRSEQRTRILDLLHESPTAMGPGEIASALGMPSGNVRRLLCSMVKDGEVTNRFRGQYRFPERPGSSVAATVTSATSGEKPFQNRYLNERRMLPEAEIRGNIEATSVTLEPSRTGPRVHHA